MTYLLIDCWIPVTVIEDNLKTNNSRVNKKTTKQQDQQHHTAYFLSTVNLSYITVSAAVRLIPRPPARVLSRKTKISALQEIKLWTWVRCKILNYTQKGSRTKRNQNKHPIFLFPSMIACLLDNGSVLDEKIDFDHLFKERVDICNKAYLDWKSATMSLLSEIFEEPSNRMYLCFL